MECTSTPSLALCMMKWKFRSFDEIVELAEAESGTFDECATVDTGGRFAV